LKALHKEFLPVKVTDTLIAVWGNCPRNVCGAPLNGVSFIYSKCALFWAYRNKKRDEKYSEVHIFSCAHFAVSHWYSRLNETQNHTQKNI